MIFLIRQMFFEMRVLILQRVKESYVVNQRDLDKKRSTAAEMCAQNRAEVVLGCVKVQQITQAALSEYVAAWKNGGGGWRITTDQNRTSTRLVWTNSREGG